MGWEDTESFLQPGVVIACDNSPQSVTISGDAPAVKAVVSAMKTDSPEMLARLLQVEKAYHFSHMAEIGPDYVRLMGTQVNGKELKAPFFSNATGERLQADCPFNANYWKVSLKSLVLLRSAVTNILQHDIIRRAVFLQVGPHSALSAPLRQILTKNTSQAPNILPMLRKHDCAESFFKATGKLYTLHVSMDVGAIFPSDTTLKDLPTYPWNHEGSVRCCWSARSVKLRQRQHLS